MGFLNKGLAVIAVNGAVNRKSSAAIASFFGGME